MRTLVYEIDHETLEAFFGEDTPNRPVVTLGPENGNLIFEGDMAIHPDAGDVLVLDGAGTNMVEYVIVCRLYFADHDNACLIVHERHYTEVELS